MKEYTIKLNEKQLELIVNALAELPYKVSKGTIEDIVKQLQENDSKE